jgi:hypothetical protein
MNVHWKDFGDRVTHPRKWSGMTWAVVLLVVACALGTGIAGFKLVQIADRQSVEFNTK